MPSRLLIPFLDPGRYAISLTGTSGGSPIVARSAFGANGAARRGDRVAGLVAHFVYVNKPFRGSKVTVSWSLANRALGR